MRAALVACLLCLSLASCTSPTPVGTSANSTPPPIDAQTGLARTGEQLPPGTMTVDVGDNFVTIHSMPVEASAQLVDYVIEYAESGDETLHIQTSQSSDSYPVQIARARFYADNYVFKAFDNVTKQIYAQKTVYVPGFNFYAPAPSP